MFGAAPGASPFGGMNPFAANPAAMDPQVSAPPPRADDHDRDDVASQFVQAALQSPMAQQMMRQLQENPEALRQVRAPSVCSG